jgi:uncharacterized membrane protein
MENIYNFKKFKTISFFLIIIIIIQFLNVGNFKIILIIIRIGYVNII